DWASSANVADVLDPVEPLLHADPSTVAESPRMHTSPFPRQELLEVMGASLQSRAQPRRRPLAPSTRP
ncbi:MAG TPA: hypothetical protein VEY89_10950, partial [Candidatus Dormibacteraeota bacterium]|nr:hypothetical protein [Candidatus Dormibacteraeota bacterium]